MLKKLMLTTAITGFTIGVAAAQTTAPNAASPAATTTTAAASSGSAQFINTQSSDQWLASSFQGTDVIGPNNEKIGDVRDVLFDKSNRVVGYVIGVGGFLGIGEKNVALAPSSFQVVAANTSTSTGSTKSANANNVQLKLNMNKDQLKQAADFKTQKQQAAENRHPATTTGSGMSNATSTGSRNSSSTSR